jgi:hypothetical protein
MPWLDPQDMNRFPEDFMSQLSAAEVENLKSQFVTSSWGGMRRARPYAFTEQGVAMLSSVLRSKRAVQVNILIMRAFVKLRQMAASHKDLLRKIEEMEKKYDGQFRAVFEAIRQLMTPTDIPRRKIRPEPSGKAVRRMAAAGTTSEEGGGDGAVFRKPIWRG